ncbi:MAG TPA: rod shape-determining protein MreD [Jatrophihabitans sp.]
MTRARVAAAIAALLTVLVLQATLVSPLADAVPASLPALLVAAIALADGPGAGIAFGFSAGLITDLGSEHPAGLLALCWMGIGLLCGRLNAPNARARHDIVIAALVCGLSTVVTTVLLVLVGADGASVTDAVRYAIPAVLIDGLLALVLVPLVRLFLHSDRLRAPRPVLVLGEAL